MNFWVLFWVFFVMVCLDKGITAINITQANKNFPDAMKEDHYKIEKNPVARWFFNKTGLIFGSILYGIVTMITLFIAFSLLSIGMSEGIALYILMIVYAFVVGNNAYFFLKFSSLIA